MLEIFLKGGPVMWPILVLSIVTVAVVLERIFFLILETRSRDQAAVQLIFQLVEHGRVQEVSEHVHGTKDMIARVLVEGLEHRDVSLSEAMLESASAELDRYNKGLVVLDTAVTLGPLLGLLGTVTGMIRAFGVIGSAELADKTTAITGGISECLIAVTFGLSVAIVAIVPLNYLNSQLERARRRLESSMTRMELLMAKQRNIEVS